MGCSAEILSARVPRYTSYPTAPHFHAGVNAQTFAGWLAALPPSLLSLYVHIPFCDSLCWFCGCHTRAVRNYAPVSSYLDLLRIEIDRVAAIASFGKLVTHIHWGGGSPTILGAADVTALASYLFSKFEVAGDAEFAIEIDPRGFSAHQAKAFAQAAVTRASIGVQDCDPDVQHAINRVQPFEVTQACVDSLREAGVTGINIDLVYGLPHQTCTKLEKSLSAILSLKPDRFAVFGYAHVPEFKKHQKLINSNALPDVEERLAQSRLAYEMLTAAGYVAIGLDHFAKTSDPMAQAFFAQTLRRNFQGYTTDEAQALIGLGASAISALPRGYVQNFASVRDYRAALDRGGLAAARGVAISHDDRIRRAIIDSLMCYLSVDLDEVCAAFGLRSRTFEAEIENLKDLVRQQVVSIEGNRISVAPDMRFAVRLVCAAFDTHLRDTPNRHAIAA